ncbi:MAG: hypothetical protein ABL958_15175 [Bdellovibrionia bacterium]
MKLIFGIILFCLGALVTSANSSEPKNIRPKTVVPSVGPDAVLKNFAQELRLGKLSDAYQRLNNQMNSVKILDKMEKDQILELASAAEEAKEFEKNDRFAIFVSKVAKGYRFTLVNMGGTWIIQVW